MFDLRTADLRKLNSLTKYPSIPTHHPLDPKTGGLNEGATEFHGTVYGTEKVDGTNGRIILLPDGSWLIGSREDLLTASGDIVHNPALGIVDALRPIADACEPTHDRHMLVLYLEVYGSRQLPAWKHYGDGQQASARLFDVAEIPMYHLEWKIEDIASWRQRGGQEFYDETGLRVTAGVFGLELTPRLFEVAAADLPMGVKGMREFMEPYRNTTVSISGEPGLNEGIVLRSADRSTITKARFQDYDRTLNPRPQGKQRKQQAAV
jgi:hypothetical protein